MAQQWTLTLESLQNCGVAWVMQSGPEVQQHEIRSLRCSAVYSKRKQSTYSMGQIHDVLWKKFFFLTILHHITFYVIMSRGVASTPIIFSVWYLNYRGFQFQYLSMPDYSYAVFRDIQRFHKLHKNPVI